MPFGISLPTINLDQLGGLGKRRDPPTPPMKPDTKVVLGDIEFTYLEVPERIPVGGAQVIGCQEHLGGIRVMQSFGFVPADVKWSGRFQGEWAAERAKHLKYLTALGLPQVLTFDFYRFIVVIETFDADHERYYQLPYSISCKVLQDLTTPIPEVIQPAVDAAITSDFTIAQTLSTQFAQTGIPAALEGVQGTLSTITSFTGTSIPVLNKLQSKISIAQGATRGAVAAGDSVLAASQTVGNVIAGAPLVDNVKNFTGQVSQMQSSVNLLQISGALGRMSTNVSGLIAGKR